MKVILRKKQNLYLNDGTYGSLFDAGVPNFILPTKMITDGRIQSKKLTSLVSEYGDLNFSKYEKYYEFHRYNAENCRIFVQNNASDKKIIHITIFNFEKNKFYKKYSRDACQ